MKEDLDKLLVTKYPKLFAERNLPMQETCMCWGFACGDGWFNLLDNLCRLIQWHIDQSEKRFASDEAYNKALRSYLDCDDPVGLYDYYDYGPTKDDVKKMDYLKGKLADAVAFGYKDLPTVCPQVVVKQVKEKFGSLRFYYNGGDEFVDGVVSMAESLSGVTCEVCGAPGESVKGGWVRVRCKEHIDG